MEKKMENLLEKENLLKTFREALEEVTRDKNEMLQVLETRTAKEVLELIKQTKNFETINEFTRDTICYLMLSLEIDIKEELNDGQ